MCDQCEEFQERIRQLEAELYNQDWMPPRELNLTSLEIAIMQAFLARPTRYMTRDFILDFTRYAYSRARKVYVENKLVDVYISKLRAKLRPHALVIETKNSVGWRLEPETARRLLNWSKPSEDIAA